MPDRTDELLPALRKTKFLLPRSLLFRRQNSSVKSFLDWKIAKITNAPWRHTKWRNRKHQPELF